jgi:hypothetical protein
MSKLKKVGLWMGGILLLSLIGSITTPLKDNIKVPVKENIEVENLTNEAVTICRMIVENSLSDYIEVSFPFANRKVFKKANQRYIIKDYVLFSDNGIKKKANWHCDLQFKGGDAMDTNNWQMLNLEILK